MEFAKNITRVSALALGIAGVLAYGDVHAAAFQLKENSVKAQGRNAGDVLCKFHE